MSVLLKSHLLLKRAALRGIFQLAVKKSISEPCCLWLVRFIGAGQVIYREMLFDWNPWSKSWTPPQLELQALHGVRVRAMDFPLGCRISSLLGVLGCRERQPSSPSPTFPAGMGLSLLPFVFQGQNSRSRGKSHPRCALMDQDFSGLRRWGGINIFPYL